jgi:hypothetical protein
LRGLGLISARILFNWVMYGARRTPGRLSTGGTCTGLLLVVDVLFRIRRAAFS